MSPTRIFNDFDLFRAVFQGKIFSGRARGAAICRTAPACYKLMVPNSLAMLVRPRRRLQIDSRCFDTEFFKLAVR